MKAIDLIKGALAMGDQAMMMLIDDMRDAPLQQPTPRGGNHPMWVLGHVTFVEGSVPTVLFGEPNPVMHWAPSFAPGTEPHADASKYPPIDDLIRTYKGLRSKNLQILDRIGETGLDRPTVAPPKGLEDALKTAGQTFMVIAMHQMNHRGQLADCRKAAGRKPIFTPGVG